MAWASLSAGIFPRAETTGVGCPFSSKWGLNKYLLEEIHEILFLFPFQYEADPFSIFLPAPWEETFVKCSTAPLSFLANLARSWKPQTPNTNPFLEMSPLPLRLLIGVWGSPGCSLKCRMPLRSHSPPVPRWDVRITCRPRLLLLDQVNQHLK